ncbi:hypothetical protein NEOLEDRAFT_153620 [Neolentinus lepideus HHB14362 ss-1]|uniref:Uncharacterized protein n=1 Tax=Neolentinus lepideus HHB14362 ss-1 TaxID=1314782 RepID=A0A165MLL7_9AGAM|nr:hypothetical protein NEOLEDRAFT_153620 [Neolentinus lepideus HHB14362 ss-1]
MHGRLQGCEGKQGQDRGIKQKSEQVHLYSISVVVLPGGCARLASRWTPPKSLAFRFSAFICAAKENFSNVVAIDEDVLTIPPRFLAPSLLAPLVACILHQDRRSALHVHVQRSRRSRRCFRLPRLPILRLPRLVHSARAPISRTRCPLAQERDDTSYNSQGWAFFGVRWFLYRTYPL